MIYTSKYSNPELSSGKYTVVGITRGAPKFPLHYHLDGNIIEIAPPGYLFNEYDRKRFTGPYFKHMDKTGVDRIASILNRYAAKGKDVVLCCFEDVRKPNEWCHRLVFAEWWLQRTGELIEELHDPSEIKKPRETHVTKRLAETEKQTVKSEPKELPPEQLRLW